MKPANVDTFKSGYQKGKAPNKSDRFLIQTSFNFLCNSILPTCLITNREMEAATSRPSFKSLRSVYLITNVSGEEIVCYGVVCFSRFKLKKIQQLNTLTFIYQLYSFTNTTTKISLSSVCRWFRGKINGYWICNLT